MKEPCQKGGVTRDHYPAQTNQPDSFYISSMWNNVVKKLQSLSDLSLLRDLNPRKSQKEEV